MSVVEGELGACVYVRSRGVRNARCVEAVHKIEERCRMQESKLSLLACARDEKVWDWKEDKGGCLS